MSNHIPFELQSEIMKRLPVKSLLRFRSVSKSYKSLIHTSDFIIHHMISQQQQHLLLRCYDPLSSYDQKEPISIVDDHNHCFPTQWVSYTVPELVKNLKYPYIIGSSHGLLCFADNDVMGKVVLWNPFIRKTVSVIMPRIVHDEIYRTVLGFGVCRETTDPKIVKITKYTKSETRQVEVEVFALSTSAWRRPYSTNLPCKTIYIKRHHVVVDGSIYWLANARSYNLIVSFDLTTEEFGEVSLPDSLTHSRSTLSLYNLRESLVVTERCGENYNQVHHVWRMEDGVSKSFKKLFTISSHLPHMSIRGVKGFRKTGEALVEVRLYPCSTRILAAYEPFSKSISNVMINGAHYVHSVDSYMETLLLL